MGDTKPQRDDRVRRLGELIASVTPDELLLANAEDFGAFCRALEHSSIIETVELVVFDRIKSSSSDCPRCGHAHDHEWCLCHNCGWDSCR